MVKKLPNSLWMQSNFCSSISVLEPANYKVDLQNSGASRSLNMSRKYR